MSSMESGKRRSGEGIIRPESVLTIGPEAAERMPGLRDEDSLLFELVDGRRTVDEIVQLSGLSPFVGVRRLRALFERHVLDLVTDGRPEAVARGASDGPRQTPTRGGKVLPLDLRRTQLGLPAASAAGILARAVSPTATPAAVTKPAAAATPASAAMPAATDATPAPAASPAPGAAVAPAASPVPVAPVAPAASPTPGAPVDPDLAGGASASASPAPAGPVPAAVPAAPSSAPALQPFRVGPYDVLTRIGQGGMGSIYLCQRRGEGGLRWTHTLKVVREHAVKLQAASDALRREGRIGALLAHPMLVRVVDVGRHEGQPYLVLDYVEGASLADLLLAPTPPRPALVVSVLLDVLRGLEYLHERPDERGERTGIVHCDVSPQNVLVGVDGLARLSDFGAARFVSERVPRGGAAVGKPGYLAPEQLREEPVDGRTDLFALGVTLWTALTGQKLFAEESYEQTVLNVLTKKIPPPSAFGAPACLDEPCLRALARAPEQRFASAGAMAEALRRAAAAEGLLATPAEVAVWVRSVAGETLSERRRRLAEAEAVARAAAHEGVASGELDTGAASPGEDRPSGRPSPRRSGPEFPTMILPAMDIERAGRPRGARRLLVKVGATAAGAVSLGLAIYAAITLFGP